MPDDFHADVNPEPGMRNYIWPLWARRGSILAVVSVVSGLMLLNVAREPKIYLAGTEVLVNALSKRPGIVEGYESPTNIEAVRRVASSEGVESLVAERLGGIDPSTEISVQISQPGGSNTLVIYVHSPSPIVAKRTADTYAETFLEFRSRELLEDLKTSLAPVEERIETLTGQVNDTEKSLMQSTEPVRTLLVARFNQLLGQRQLLEQQRNELSVLANRQVGQILRPAALPTQQNSPHRLRTLLTALFFGSALGLGQAIVRSQFFPRVQGRRELSAELGAPVLATLPPSSSGRHGAVLASPGSTSGEAYALLTATMLSTVERHGLRSLLIASCQPNERTAGVVANLAAGLAVAGKRVVLAPFETDGPTLKAYFCSDKADDALPVATTFLPGLRLFAHSSLELGSAYSLTPGAVSRLVEHLSGDVDLVIVSAPPLLDSGAALAAAAVTDGVILVATADHTTVAAIAETRVRLEEVGADVVGAVLRNIGRARILFEQHVEGPSTNRGAGAESPARNQKEWAPQLF